MTTTSAELNASDHEAIQAVIDDVAEGLALRDPDRCVARFAPDARSVIANGVRTVGREAIRASHAAVFASGAVPTSPRFVVLDAHAPRPDLAIVTTGAYPDGGGDIDLDRPPTVVTWTMVREADGWWIAARQFTPVPA